MKEMNVVGVISSANLNGNSATLLRETLAGVKDAKAKVTEVFLPNFNISFCKGCMRCMSEGKCIQKDDFEQVL